MYKPEQIKIKESSMIAEMWVDPYSNRLWVKFKKGGNIFKYEDVPTEILNSIPQYDSNESVGKWFHTHIYHNANIKFSQVEKVGE